MQNNFKSILKVDRVFKCHCHTKFDSMNNNKKDKKKNKKKGVSNGIQLIIKILYTSD